MVTNYYGYAGGIVGMADTSNTVTNSYAAGDSITTLVKVTGKASARRIAEYTTKVTLAGNYARADMQVNTGLAGALTPVSLLIGDTQKDGAGYLAADSLLTLLNVYVQANPTIGGVSLNSWKSAGSQTNSYIPAFVVVPPIVTATVEARQSATWKAWGGEGALYLSGTVAGTVLVYDTMGKLINRVADPSVLPLTLPMQPGIYIVKVGTETRKIMVK